VPLKPQNDAGWPDTVGEVCLKEAVAGPLGIGGASEGFSLLWEAGSLVDLVRSSHQDGHRDPQASLLRDRVSVRASALQFKEASGAILRLPSSVANDAGRGLT